MGGIMNTTAKGSKGALLPLPISVLVHWFTWQNSQSVISLTDTLCHQFYTLKWPKSRWQGLESASDVQPPLKQQTLTVSSHIQQQSTVNLVLPRTKNSCDLTHHTRDVSTTHLRSEQTSRFEQPPQMIYRYGLLTSLLALKKPSG